MTHRVFGLTEAEAIHNALDSCISASPGEDLIEFGLDSQEHVNIAHAYLSEHYPTLNYMLYVKSVN